MAAPLAIGSARAPAGFAARVAVLITRSFAALLGGLAFAAAAAPGQAGSPPPGRYAATLCVVTSANGAPGCGAAEFDLRPDRRARLQVADIVYRLHLQPGQLDVLTMQGLMQIDAFSTAYVWQDRMLRFSDPDKGVRYEVRLGARRDPPPR
jgi:hypothetical protein